MNAFRLSLHTVRYKHRVLSKDPRFDRKVASFTRVEAGHSSNPDNVFASARWRGCTRRGRIGIAWFLDKSLKTLNHPLLIKPGSRNRKIGSLFEDPSGEIALDMPRLSKRWQILELYRFNGHVYATPTLINPCVFR